MPQIGMQDPESERVRRKARYVDDAGILRVERLFQLEDMIRDISETATDTAGQLADLTQSSVRRFEVMERHIAKLEVANGTEAGAAIKPDRSKRAVGKVGD